MPAQRFLGQHLEAHALHAAGGAGEAAVDHLVAEADRFEDLGALVGLERRDAHLGHDFEHALGHALAVRGDDLVVVRVLPRVQPAVAARLPQGLKGQVGIDRVGTVADQQAVMMDFAGLARFHQDADPRAFGLPHQMVMHGPAGQQAS